MSTGARVDSKKYEEAVRKIVSMLTLASLRAYFLMLGLGVLHNDWTSNVPALGFWASLIVSLAISGIGGR